MHHSYSVSQALIQLRSYPQQKMSLQLPYTPEPRLLRYVLILVQPSQASFTYRLRLRRVFFQPPRRDQTWADQLLFKSIPVAMQAGDPSINNRSCSGRLRSHSAIDGCIQAAESYQNTLEMMLIFSTRSIS